MSKTKNRELYKLVDGKKEDRDLHEGVLDNKDKKFMKKINKMYKTAK